MKKMKRCRHNGTNPAAAAALLLPIEITSEIFLRLELQELCRCRLVCKAWYELIENPNFGDLHHRRQLHRRSNLVVFYSPPTESLFLVDVNSKTKLESDSRLGFGLHASKPLALPSHRRCLNRAPIIVGSSNGLFCLHEYHANWTYDGHDAFRVSSLAKFRINVVANTRLRTYYILNPITKHIVQLPYAPPPDSPSRCLGYRPDSEWYGCTYIIAPSGFAFDATTGTYKLIQAWCFYEDFEPTVQKAGFNMLTVGSSKWTRIHEMSATMFFPDQGPPVFVNNALHWQMARVGIGAIRLGDAPTFAALKLPRIRYSTIYQCLTSLNGCLSFICGDYYNKVTCWTMDEYGVDSSWSSKFAFCLKQMVPRDVFRAERDRSPRSAYSNYSFRIVTAMDNENTILVTDGEYIICCDLEKKEHRLVEVDGLPPARERRYAAPIAHIGSLISPETVAGFAQINIRPKRRKNVECNNWWNP